MRLFGKKIVFVDGDKKEKSKGLLDEIDDKSVEDEDFFGYEDNEDKWVDIEITIMAPYSELIKLKNTLKPYAEELGWEIESGSRTEVEDNTKIGGGKLKRVNITIKPEGGSISPVYLLNNKDKIWGLVFSIHRDLLYRGDNQKAVKNFLRTINITYTRTKDAKPNKNDYIINESLSFLNYSYKLMDRLKFEKRNKKLAIEIFRKTAEEDVKDIFKESGEGVKIKKKDKKSDEEYKDFMKDYGGNLEESSKKFKKEIEDLFGWKL